MDEDEDVVVVLLVDGTKDKTRQDTS